MNWDHRTRKVLVTGISGSGKTTLALRLLKRWKARNVFIFDPDREFSRKLKWPAATALNQLNHAAANGVPVCYDPQTMFSDYCEAFDFFCRWVFNVSTVIQGKKVFVCDEMQRWTKTGRGGIPESLTEILDKGRREEIDLLLLGQSPNRVHDVIRLQLTETFTFRQVDALPLKTLWEMGFDPEEVKRLTYPGGYIYRNLMTGQTLESDRKKTRDSAKGD